MESLVLSHLHDRTATLEEQVHDLGAALARNTERIEALTCRMDDGFERLTNQLDQLTEIARAVGTAGQRLDRLEHIERERAGRIRAVSKWAGAIVASVVSAFLIVWLGIKP